MGIVVDTSVVIAVAANEPLKPRLVEMTRGQELVAPATLPWEIGNAVSALVAQFQQIPILLVDVALGECVKIAAERNIYAYDAYVIRCAQQTGYPILSLDGGLCEAARRAGVTLLEVKP